MDCTDSNGSIGPRLTSDVAAQPAAGAFLSTVVEDYEQSLSWKLADASDVTVASRRCVETVVAHRLMGASNGVGDRHLAGEPNRFTLSQLYSQPKVTVDLHWFDPTDPSERERLQRYARQLQAIDRAAIPAYVDAFELETPFGPGFAIVQAAIEAKSIQEWIDDGYCFDESEMMLIALRVLATLKYLHGETPDSKGCTVHRAIKPSNILLENRRVADPFLAYEPARERRNKDRRDRGFGRLYLVNLGRATFEDETGTLTASGTYGYTAPEQFYGRSQPASDLYSLGATLIYIASGQSPSNWMRSDLQIVPGSIALSRPFSEWISRLTHADLAQRTASASTALQELELLQLVGVQQVSKPLAADDYSLAKPRRSLARTPQTIYMDFKVISTPQELKIRFNYDRISGDKSQRRSAANGIISPEELKMALLLVLAVAIIGSTVALTGSPFLGFVVALLLPGFYFILVPPTPVVEPVERQANIRLRRDMYGRMFVTLSTTQLPKRRHKQRALAQSAFLESKIHFANVPIRLLCTKPGLLTPKIRFIMATSDPNRTEKVAITGTQEEIRWLRVHVGRWLKS